MPKQKRDRRGKFAPKERWFEFLDDLQLEAIISTFERLADLKALADERPLTDSERDRAMVLQMAAHRLEALGRERQGEAPCVCDRCRLIERAIAADDRERRHAAASLAVVREDEREARRERMSSRHAVPAVPLETDDEPIDDEFDVDEIEEEA